MFKALLFITLFALLSNTVYSAQSLCDKYGNATSSANQTVLIKDVVLQAVGHILADGGLRKFFDGSYTVKTNFTSDGTSLNALAGKLISFFGTALGCTDGTIPMYQGNLAAAHASMNITYSEFNKFNYLVVQTLKEKGFEDADAAAVASVLNGASLRSTCTSTDMSCGMLCNRYSVPWNLNNSALVSLVVSKTVTAALGSNLLKPFFDGTTPSGSTNFTDPSKKGAFDTLSSHLVQFFGVALGCSDGSIGAYQGSTNLKAVHANMPINKAAFEAFNSALVAQMGSLGVAQADLDAVAAVLASTKADICNQADCASGSSSMMGSSMGGSSMASSMGGSSMASSMGGSSMASSMGSSKASSNMGSTAVKSSTSATPSTTGNAYTLIFSVIALFVTLLI